MSLFRKGLVLIAIPLAFQIAFVAVLIVTQNELTKSSAEHRRLRTTIREANHVLRHLIDAETGSRGYALTSDPVYKQPFIDAEQQLVEHLTNLNAAASVNVTESAAVDEIASLADTSLQFERQIVELVDRNQLDRAMIAIRSGQGKQQMDRVRGAVASFNDSQEAIVWESEQAIAGTRRLIGWVLFGGTIVTFSVSALLALAFSRGVVRRLGIMTENARLVAQRKSPLMSLTGHDELAKLDQAFHAMADELAVIWQKDRENALRLAGQVEQQTTELAMTNRSLTHSNEENEMFVYSVSHDLRAPLVNLEGFSRELAAACEELRECCAGEESSAETKAKSLQLIDDDIYPSLRFIQAGVTRLSLIIDALLRLSRVGRIEYRCEHIETAEVVARVVDSLQHSIADRQVQVEVGELPAVLGDPSAVEQVFGNLIANALNYLDPKRPGQIAISVADTVPEPAEHVTFAINDNGVGIPELHRSKVFQTFQRLRPDLGKGEGIGLAMTRRIIERHGGRIWFESQENQGTTFYFTLPSANVKPNPQPPTRKPELAYGY